MRTRLRRLFASRPEYSSGPSRFESPEVVEGYLRWQSCSVAEQMALDLSISQGDKVFDVGCGTGRVSSLVDSLGGIYSGIDSSQSMIHSAVTLRSDIDVRVADVCSVEIPKNDVVLLMHNTLGQFYPGSVRKQVISRLSASLSGAGRLVLSVHLNNGPFSKESRSLLDVPRKIFRLVLGRGYALQNYHGYRVMMYRSSPRRVVEEFSALGFRPLAILPDHSRETVDWVYYVFVKVDDQ